MCGHHFAFLSIQPNVTSQTKAGRKKARSLLDMRAWTSIVTVCMQGTRHSSFDSVTFLPTVGGWLHYRNYRHRWPQGDIVLLKSNVFILFWIPFFPLIDTTKESSFWESFYPTNLGDCRDGSLRCGELWLLCTCTHHRGSGYGWPWVLISSLYGLLPPSVPKSPIQWTGG